MSTTKLFNFVGATAIVGLAHPNKSLRIFAHGLIQYVFLGNFKRYSVFHTKNIESVIRLPLADLEDHSTDLRFFTTIVEWMVQNESLQIFYTWVDPMWFLSFLFAFVS